MIIEAWVLVTQICAQKLSPVCVDGQTFNNACKTGQLDTVLLLRVHVTLELAHKHTHLFVAKTP